MASFRAGGGGRAGKRRRIWVRALQFQPASPIDDERQGPCRTIQSWETGLQFGLSFKLIGYVAAGVLMTSAAIGVVRVQNERGPGRACGVQQALA